jgi:hypothetical protein
MTKVEMRELNLIACMQGVRGMRWKSKNQSFSCCHVGTAS